MKKTILSIFITFMSIQLSPIMGVCDIEVRAACLIPTDNHFRSVYGNTVCDWEFEVSTPLENFLDCTSCWAENINLTQWYGWANFSYYTKNGHFTYLKEETNALNWTLNFGVKRYFCCGSTFLPYFGLGVGVAHVRFSDHSFYVRQNINLWGFSLLAKSGVEVQLAYNLFLDFFLDYSYNRFSKPHAIQGISTRGVNTGGFKIGLGIGYRI